MNGIRYVVGMVALLTAILVLPASAATTWYVDDSGGADFTTIQDAVNASTDGDTIIVRDGTYIESVVVNKRLTIRSENGSELTTVQPPEGYYTPIFKLTVDYVNISGFTAQGEGPYTYDPEWVGKALSDGIAINHANYCSVTKNKAVNCAYGIHVGYYSNNNTVLQNNCSWNRDHGIKLDMSSDNIISHNICRGTWHDDNIDLTASANNVISNNICIDGLDDGIYLSGSSYNMVVNNTCENNAECGIHGTGGGNIISNNTCSGSIQGIYIGTGNTVTYNTVLNNSGCGLWIAGSNSTIYLNNIIDNGVNVHASSGNIWNSTEQLTYTYNGNSYTNSLGNHWATYTGNDTDGDGIGNTPFYIEGTQYDYRPLMAPFENYAILTSVTVSPSSATPYSGTPQQFTATAYDQTHEEMPGVGVTWTSSNETVGTIDSNGLFTAFAPGTATVTATNGTVNGTATVTVLLPPITLWGPYVTKTTTNATVINWKTENATTGSVQYATDAYYVAQGTYELTVADTNESHLHHLNLTNLTPGTVYHYRVCIGNESTGDCTFRTFPLSGSFTFIVYGDSQEPQGDPEATQLTRHKLVADRIAAEENVTFVLHAGDLVNDGSDLEEWTRFFEAARAMMATTTVYPTLGNHEYASYGGGPGDPEQNYYNAFGVPEWYSFDCSDTHFTVLDSNDQADVPTETAWLINDLGSDSAATASWKFVAFHHPPYSSSAKHYGGWTYFRDLWCPLFINSSVDAVFNGHVHAYERLKADGIHYLVVGTGGGPIYDLAEPRIPESQNSLEWSLGYVKITIDADTKLATLEMVAVADLSSGELELYPPRTVFETFILWQAQGLCGDVNGDGKVTMGDGRLIYLNVIYGDAEYPLANPWAADVNGDGRITMGDGRLVYLNVIYGAEEYPLEC